MRIGVFLAVLIAFAQPAFAKQNSHRHHHTKHHHVHARHHHVPAPASATQAFVRTDAVDRPFFSDPSLPNRAWSQTPAQQYSSFEPARRVRSAPVRDGALDAAIARHAAANGLPADLVHRVVIRESRYNPRARNGGNLGLMQIKHATARGVGYTGSAAGLMDAETNLTYAVRYLAGAYRAAGGNASRAVSYYASGYHGRGVRQPVQTVAWSAPTEMRSARVAMRDEPATTTMRDDAMRFARY